jgi:Potential Queuosine, Q, salvage protein family
MEDLRRACAAVAERAEWVRVRADAIAPYARTLPSPVAEPGSEPELAGAGREQLAAFWLTLDAINFGSGWFPTLSKRDGRSGYQTIAAGIHDRFAGSGPWTAAELTQLDAAAVADVLGQRSDHELMALFAGSLNDLGARVLEHHGGSFAAVVDGAGQSAVALARSLGGWTCFADSSRYGELELPFLKRAQIAASDLHRAGVETFGDLSQLTMFADNLVPHVLRLDDVLAFDERLTTRIERGELIDHGSAEEVEIRACAVHAVELIAASRQDVCAAEVDQILWRRGQGRAYKARPRPRCRTTAY